MFMIFDCTLIFFSLIILKNNKTKKKKKRKNANVINKTELTWLCPAYVPFFFQDVRGERKINGLGFSLWFFVSVVFFCFCFYFVFTFCEGFRENEPGHKSRRIFGEQKLVIKRDYCHIWTQVLPTVFALHIRLCCLLNLLSTVNCQCLKHVMWRRRWCGDAEYDGHGKLPCPLPPPPPRIWLQFL